MASPCVNACCKLLLNYMHLNIGWRAGVVQWHTVIGYVLLITRLVMEAIKTLPYPPAVRTLSALEPEGGQSPVVHPCLSLA